MMCLDGQPGSALADVVQMSGQGTCLRLSHLYSSVVLVTEVKVLVYLSHLYSSVVLATLSPV